VNIGMLLHSDNMRELDLPLVSRTWTQEFRRRKAAAPDHRYYMLCHAQELTRHIDVLADCGLQRDIRRFPENILRYGAPGHAGGAPGRSGFNRKTRRACRDSSRSYTCG
jgi:hypothetical protein